MKITSKNARQLLAAIGLTAGLTAGLVESSQAKSSYNINRDFPPFNVSAKDIKKLFGGRVMVSYLVHQGGSSHLSIGVHTKDGRLIYCEKNAKKKFQSGTVRWWPSTVKKGDRIGHGFFWSPKRTGAGRHWSVVQYSAHTGKVELFTPSKRTATVFVRVAKGHLQKDIPAVVYEKCPGFPSAKSLGLAVNKRQTATSYRRLVSQSSGQRVKRPDLVSPGLRKLALPKNRRKK